MTVQVNETTKITIPIKTFLSVVSAVVVASWYVFTTQSRITDLEHTVEMAQQRFQHYTEQPSRNHTEVALLAQKVEYLKTEVEQLKKGK